MLPNKEKNVLWLCKREFWHLKLSAHKKFTDTDSTNMIIYHWDMNQSNILPTSERVYYKSDRKYCLKKNPIKTRMLVRWKIQCQAPRLHNCGIGIFNQYVHSLTNQQRHQSISKTKPTFTCLHSVTACGSSACGNSLVPHNSLGDKLPWGLWCYQFLTPVVIQISIPNIVTETHQCKETMTLMSTDENGTASPTDTARWSTQAFSLLTIWTLS